jgi:hypothetical protein
MFQDIGPARTRVKRVRAEWFSGSDRTVGRCPMRLWVGARAMAPAEAHDP